MALQDMAAIAAECVKTPGRVSIWSAQQGKYVCEGDPRFSQEKSEPTNRASISPGFKLVFLTSAGGTVLFILICVVTTIVAGKEMPAPLDKMIQGLFDLAKIGFGAVVGLLGGQSIKRDSQISN